MKKSILFLIILTGIIQNIDAQVTIGSGTAPVKGAILQLKEYESTESNFSTATKGFSYPRVALSKTNDLYPMYDIGYPEVSDIDAEKKSNTGLVVYNITENEQPNANTDVFVKGLYIWDGVNWTLLQSNKVIEAQISELICNSATLTPGSYEIGSLYKGVLKVPYAGGNGGFYEADSTFSINGLGFTRQAGQLAMGNGEIYYIVEGTPTVTSPEMINVPINFLGMSCTTSIGNMQEVKSITFAKTAAKNITTENVASQTITSLGNLSVRVEYIQYSGFPANWSYFLAYKVGIASHVTVLYSKSGRSVGYLVSGRKAALNTEAWYRVKTSAYYDESLILDENMTAGPNGNKDDLNPENRDVVESIFMLHNTSEIYRVTINSNGAISASGPIEAVPAAITIFLEKLD